MTKRIAALATFIALSVVGAVAYAQPVMPDVDPAGFFSFLLEKLQAGEWIMAFGGALVGVVWVLRTLLAPRVAWFKTRLGGWALNFGTAGVLAIGTAMMAAGPAAISISLMMSAFSAALLASGGWAAVSDLIKSRNSAE